MDELEQVAKFGDAVFIPSHLTRALLATGIAIGAGGISFVAAGYALFEFKRVKVEEVAAMLKPPNV